MDIYVTLILIGLGVYAAKNREQRQRIALLGHCLQPYQLEKLMEQLTEGYLRALGEADPERRQQIWNLLATTEQTLCRQFDRLAADVARLGEVQTRVSTWPLALPWATRLAAGATFDLREALAIHAKGIAFVAQNTQDLSPKDKAYMLSAELFLFQHTCHWFCRSKMVASARLLTRHKTPYEQVLDSVSSPTRQAWRALLGS
ncbi:hypothetical protein H010_15949 [Hydrogenophaga taeniospiralis CCUG 15921]|uniref:Uncharacterized protein n=1 Tax=Hydrogenophaga taeniospiralis CCUG 15921 TaxID=1281780 RepID=A0A9X4NSW2_9BURK|nr:hypothetical protein [Hydrogenophaga taeniospiralis]MDG5976762.1 hypothetical protein [Hydrogenophaga taeniospiralis CCUG 15921]